MQTSKSLSFSLPFVLLFSFSLPIDLVLGLNLQCSKRWRRRRRQDLRCRSLARTSLLATRSSFSPNIASPFSTISRKISEFESPSNHQIIRSSNHQIIKSSNHQIITSSDHQIVKLTNKSDEKDVKASVFENKQQTSVVTLGVGPLIAFGGADHVIRIFDADRWALHAKIPIFHKALVHLWGGQIGRDKFIISVGSDFQIAWWRATESHFLDDPTHRRVCPFP